MVLGPGLPHKSDDTRELSADEGPEHPIGAVRGDPPFGDRERPFAFLGIARREGVRMLGEAAQAQRPIGDGVIGYEASDRELR
jgi:hypothetical protein